MHSLAILIFDCWSNYFSVSENMILLIIISIERFCFFSSICVFTPFARARTETSGLRSKNVCTAGLHIRKRPVSAIDMGILVIVRPTVMLLNFGVNHLGILQDLISPSVEG